MVDDLEVAATRELLELHQGKVRLDTTGVEPDFALVKFKKLAGGGYFKIINHSVPPALASLGYSAEQIDDIMAGEPPRPPSGWSGDDRGTPPDAGEPEPAGSPIGGAATEH